MIVCWRTKENDASQKLVRLGIRVYARINKVRTSMYVSLSLSIYIYIYIYVCITIYINMCINIYTYIYMYICLMCIYIYIYIDIQGLHQGLGLPLRHHRAAADELPVAGLH